MKAKIQPRINTEGRTKLEEVIPLDTPFIVFVDPSSLCNFKCKFCPTGDKKLMKRVGRFQGTMDFDLFTKIIDDLQEFSEPIKVLRMYKDGEPLLNKRFADMIRYAASSDKIKSIDTTTNGALLTPEKSLEILEAGIDRINISVNGISDAQFKKFTGAKVDFKKYVDNIRFLFENKGKCEICLKTTEDIIGPENKEKFYLTFGDICDRIFIENTAPCWPEFDVEAHSGIKIQEEGIYKNELVDVQVCPYIFYSFSVNACGRASACFLDWSRGLLIGDARTESLKNIWNGEQFHYLRVGHLTRNKHNIEMCDDCGQLKYGMPDNIDEFAEEIIERMM